MEMIDRGCSAVDTGSSDISEYVRWFLNGVV